MPMAIPSTMIKSKIDKRHQCCLRNLTPKNIRKQNSLPCAVYTFRCHLIYLMDYGKLNALRLTIIKISVHNKQQNFIVAVDWDTYDRVHSCNVCEPGCGNESKTCYFREVISRASCWIHFLLCIDTFTTKPIMVSKARLV